MTGEPGQPQGVGLARDFVEAVRAGAGTVEPDVYAAGLRAIMRPMVLRWLLVAIGVALAVALIVQGYPLIGGLFGTAAVVRAAILLRWRNRRGQKRRRDRGYNDPG